MDVLTPDQRRKNMRNIRSKDTSIEISLRRAIWHAGIRYRKNYKKLPGKPDIAITKYRIAIFCDSSFFHGRDYETKKKPGTNQEFWDKKIRRNIERDEENNRQLRAMGWTVLRFWDTEIKKDLEGCLQTIKEAVFQAKTDSSREEDVYDCDICTGQDIYP